MKARLLTSAWMLAGIMALDESAALAQDAGASAAEANGSDEIIVQARRRDERLLDVPISVTALSADDLKDAGIQSVVDVQQYTPGLNVAEGVDDNTARFFIRGIGTATPTVGIEPSVPVYIDDIYTPSGIGSNISLFAVDRIEVLRGPQGTLYGRNSFGGAIKVYTQGFSNETEGYVEAAVGNADRRDIKAEIRTPVIADKLWIGGGVAILQRDGYQRLVNIDKKGWAEDSRVYKAKVQFDPMEDVRLTFAYDLTKSDAPAKHAKVTNIGNPVFNTSLFTLYPGIVPNLAQSSDDPDVIDTNVDGNSVVDAEGFTWSGTIQASDALTVKYLGSRRSMQNIRIFDIDGTAAPFLTVNEDFRIKGESHELQLNWSAGRLDLVAGAFYYKERTSSRAAEVNNFLSFLDVDGLAQPVVDSQGRQTAVDIRRIIPEGLSQRTESAALYLNGSFEIVDGLNLSAGIRWTQDDKATRGTQPSITFVGGSLAEFGSSAGFELPAGATVIDTTFGGQLSGSRKFKAVTPEASIDYKLNPDQLLYASYKRGFQGGTFFPASNVVPGSALSTDEQTVDAFEIGSKGAYANGAIRLNVALYYYKFNDLIVSVSTPVPIAVSATGFAGVPQNAGAANSKGAEIEGQFTLADGLRLTTNLAYNDFSVTEVLSNTTGTPANVADTFLDVATLAPKWQGNVGAEYTAEFAPGSVRLFANAAFRSKMGINAANASESSGIGLVAANPVTDRYFISNGTTNVSAGVTFTSADDHWRIDLTGFNLLDQRRPVAAVAVVPEFFGAIRQWNEPVNWRLSATYRF